MKLTFCDSCLCVSLPILFQGWPLTNRLWRLSVSCLSESVSVIIHLEESHLPCSEDLQATLWRGSSGKETSCEGAVLETNL